MNVGNIACVNTVIINKKMTGISIDSCFFFRAIRCESYELFSKHNGSGFISEIFDLR